MKENKALQEANDKLQRMSEDEELQRIAELREKAILDDNTNRIVAFKRGKEEGSKEKENELIKNMIKKGIDIETISNITQMSVEKLKEEFYKN